MPQIDKYGFGSIVIDGKKHRKDVLLFPDGLVRDRKKGFWILGRHSIRKEEVEVLLEKGPDTVIIGTGARARAKLTSDAESVLQEAGVEIFILRSKEAVKSYNRQAAEGRKVAALIHITC